MTTPDLEQLAARIQTLEAQLSRSRRQRRTAAAAALGGGALLWATVALSAPGSPLACTRANLYCFGSGQPAVAEEVNSNFETLAKGVDSAANAAAKAQTTADNAASAVVTKLPLSGGTMTGDLAFDNTAKVVGRRDGGSIAIEPGPGSDHFAYLSWTSGSGAVIGNGKSKAYATFDAAKGVTTIGTRRVPSEIVTNSCNAASCAATCPAGTTIKLAFGVHGGSVSATGGSWNCGNAVGWMGNCLGKTSCEVATGCSTSAMWIECW